MGFLFNCLFPAADAPPAKAPPEGESKLQGDHSASTPTPSSPPPVEVLKPRPALTLSTIIIPTAPDESFQITPRTFATISKDIGKVTRVATTLTSKNACSEITRVAFSSDEDGKIYFIKPAIAIETNEATSNDDSDSPHSLVVPFQGPRSEVTSLEFSQDKNTKLLAAWENGKVMAFDAKDGSILYECKAPENLKVCAFSKNGKRVVIGGKHGWMMFDFDKFPSRIESDEFTSLSEGKGDAYVFSVTFSDDDDKLAVGVAHAVDGGQGCYIYDTNGTKTHLLSTFCKGEPAWKVAFSPNKMILAVGCVNTVHLFNVGSGDSIRTFQIKGGCFGIQFSNEGHRIFISTRALDTATYDMLYGYDVYSGTLEFEIKCSKPVFSIAMLNDKTLLATVEDDYCKVINIAVKPTHPMEHDERMNVDRAVSPNGKWIVFTYKSKGFKVYNTFNNKLVWKEEGTEAYSVCFSPCSKKFACIADRAISICNMGDKKFKRIETPDYFDWIEFLEDGQHIGGFQEKTSTAYVIKLDKDDTAEEQLPIVTSIVILCACVVPQKKLFAIATKEEILFYNITDGQPNERLTFKFNNDQDGTLQAMQFTSDGSKMVLCSNTHVHTYKFHSDQGVDSSSKCSTILPISRDEATKDRRVIISTDAKLAAFHDKDQNHFYICSLEKSGTERGVVHQCSMHTKIRIMHFLPRLSTESRHCLVVTYGKRTTTLEVTAKEGVIDDTSVLFRSLDVCYPKDAILNLISKHKEVLYCRNEKGMTLAEYAIEQKRPDVLREIIDVDPLLAWISVKVLMYFIKTSDETMLELIMIVFKCLPPIDPAILEELTKEIPELAENGSIDIICYILEAGALKCPSGFAPGKTTYLNAFLNFDMFGSLLLDKNKPCDGTRVIPKASSFPNDLNMYNGHVLDDTKRIQLNIARVLLPGLSNYAVLNALVDMDLSSGEEGEGSSVIPQHLKPFGYLSLQASIQNAWYSWARAKFRKRALVYVFYMVCIICLEYTTTMTWLRVSVIATICIGWCYFVRIEVHQLNKKLVFRYMYDFWNIWQILSLVLVPIYVCLNIVDMVISNSTRTTIFSQHEWFPGLVHLFTLINFLYYLRGIQKMSWILYALGVLIKKMSYFLFILLWILIAACFQLAKIPGAFDTKQAIHIFAETYLTAIFGAFESDPYIGASSVVLTLFIILSLIFIIFMNAMIALISEAFANILDYQKAILHREMACLIVEVYDSMNEEERTQKEKNYKWVYKLFKQTDLNKIKSGDTESDADGRRATKLDVAKVRKECGEMKMENAELKSSLERIEKALEKMISIE